MSDETSTSASSTRSRWLTMGIVGAIIVGLAFGGGFLSRALGGSAAPVATYSARPVPTTTADAEKVRTCSVGSLLTAKAMGTATAIVGTQSSGKSLMQKNAADPVAMGSVMKLVTSAVALQNLGPTGRLVTRVVDGSTPGTIILIGGGDPTLSAGGETVYPGAPSINDLATQTVTAYQAKHPGTPITQVFVDLSMFPISDAWNSSWPTTERTQGYQPMIVPLMVDGDRANPGLQTSPRSTDPAGKAAQAFVDALKQAGNGDGDITIDYGVAPSNAKQLASVSSQPVSTLIGQMIPNSDNTLAEMLMRASSVKAGFGGGTDSIQQLVLGSLNTVGVDMTGGTFVDGSGESYKDLLPPRAMFELVRAIFGTGSGIDFSTVHDALPVSGQSGTLATRFTGANAFLDGKVRAKTGWIKGFYSLAGQVDAQGTPLDFVIVAHGTVDATAMVAIDNLVAGIYHCGTNLAAY